MKKKRYRKDELLAKQFVMKRIEGFEIEEQRKYYLEPKLVDEWSYYVYCTWKDNTVVRGWDLDYLYDTPLGMPKYLGE
jgi:hypothetical protein